MNTPRRILKNAAALAIANVGKLIGNIVLFSYLSRMLQVEGLGIYATVLAVFHMTSIGCGLGFSSFIPREMPKDFSKTNRYLVHASLTTFIGALALTILLNALVAHLGYLPQTTLGIRIISLTLIPTALQIVLDATFVAHQKTEFITITSILNVLGRILASLLALRLGFGVISLIIVYTAFGYLTLLVTIYFLTRHVVLPHWEFDRHFLKSMLLGLRFFTALALLGTLFSQIEVFILSLTQNETQVGFYSAALKLVTIWSMIPTSFMTVMFPVLTIAYQEYRQKAINMQNKSIKYLWATAFPMAVGMTVLADEIILQFYGPGFEEAAWALRLLSWYLPLNFCNTVLWRIMLARDEQHLVLRGQLIADTLRAFLSLLLTPSLGYQGAAWALIIGRLIFIVQNIYYVRRDGTHIPLVQLGWRFALASAIMGMFSWICIQWIHLVVLIPLAAGVYVALIVLLRAFSPNDRMLFRQISRQRAQPVGQKAATID